MAEREPRQDPDSTEDARLTSLDERLRRAQAEETKRVGMSDMVANDIATYRSPATRVLSVLVGYPIGCALIGYAIDRFAGTRGVWVAMIFVGFVVAMWEVWKLSKQDASKGAREE